MRKQFFRKCIADTPENRNQKIDFSCFKIDNIFKKKKKSQQYFLFDRLKSK